jgi:hypothetical protein
MDKTLFVRCILSVSKENLWRNRSEDVCAVFSKDRPCTKCGGALAWPETEWEKRRALGRDPVAADADAEGEEGWRC